MADTHIHSQSEARVIADLARQAGVATHLKVDREVHLVALPEGWRFETMPAKPVPDYIARDSKVIDRQSFIDYCVRWTNPNSEYYVSESTRTVLCKVDASQAPDWNPSFEDHKVTLTMRFGREFEKWHAIHNKWLSQVELSEHLEERHRDIIKPDDQPKAPTGLEMYQVAREFRLSRHMTFGSAIDLTSGEIELKYKQANQAEQTVSFPEQFFLGIPIIRGGEPFQIRLRARYRASEGELKLSVSIMDLEKTIEDAIALEVAQIRAAFPVNLFVNIP